MGPPSSRSDFVAVSRALASADGYDALGRLCWLLMLLGHLVKERLKDITACGRKSIMRWPMGPRILVRTGCTRVAVVRSLGYCSAMAALAANKGTATPCMILHSASATGGKSLRNKRPRKTDIIAFEH